MCKIKEVLLAIVVIGFLLIGVVPTVLAGPVEESDQITEQWIKAFNEGNAEALSALYARDAVYISWAGPFRVEGREAIRAMFAGFFRAFPTRSIVLRDTSRKVYADTVISHFNWSLVYGDAKGTMKTVYGRSNNLAMVVEGRRVIVDNFTSLIPIAGP
jgi:uncharacterized protein (TIGR02246 family)